MVLAAPMERKRLGEVSGIDQLDARVAGEGAPLHLGMLRAALYAHCVPVEQSGLRGNKPFESNAYGGNFCLCQYID